ncbi:TonB family protein [Flavihumibacter sp. R14]|nr:TonB family protein [Flavihumibacter soli]
MRFVVLLLASFIYFLPAEAQKKQNLYFLKFSGEQVNHKDSADYIRVIQEPDSGSVNFKVLEFFTNNARRFIGEVSAFEAHLIYEGSSMRFYKNGQKEKIITYKNGIPVGNAYYFYSNGKLHKILEHGSEGIKVTHSYNKSYHYKLQSFYDSTGVQLVTNGKGHVNENVDHFNEEGDYLNGMREGSWKFKHLKKPVTSEEIYKSGQFISGRIINADGSITNYSNDGSLPEFKGGIAAFNKFLSRNVKYPEGARLKGIMGKVLISFVVESDGTMADIKLLNSVHPLLDKEALRVVRRSPNWIPGYQHGIPVRVAYTVPIAFTF